MTAFKMPAFSKCQEAISQMHLETKNNKTTSREIDSGPIHQNNFQHLQ